MVDVRRVPAGQHDEAISQLLDMAEATRRAGRAPLDESTLLRLSHHGLDHSDLWMAEGGFALVHHTPGHSTPGHSTPDHSTPDQSALDLAVIPACRRQGVGRALLDEVLATVPGRVTAWSHEDHPGAAALARSTGFHRARELVVMRRPLTAADAGQESDPRIRAFRETDAAELLRVNAEAFAWHPEQGSMDAAQLDERMAEPWFDPAGLLVATEGDRMLGFHWTKVHPGGEGEVYVIGVEQQASGLGLGRALTAAGLSHLAAAGCRRVHLYVEASNVGAMKLYAGMGFTQDHVHTQYIRDGQTAV